MKNKVMKKAKFAVPRAPMGFSDHYTFPNFPHKFRLKFAIFLYFSCRFGWGGSPKYSAGASVCHPLRNNILVKKEKVTCE